MGDTATFDVAIGQVTLRGLSSRVTHPFVELRFERNRTITSEPVAPRAGVAAFPSTQCSFLYETLSVDTLGAKTLDILVWDWDRLGQHRAIGRASASLRTVATGPVAQALPLHGVDDAAGGFHRRGAPAPLSPGRTVGSAEVTVHMELVGQVAAAFQSLHVDNVAFSRNLPAPDLTDPTAYVLFYFSGGGTGVRSFRSKPARGATPWTWNDGAELETAFFHSSLRGMLMEASSGEDNGIVLKVKQWRPSAGKGPPAADPTLAQGFISFAALLSHVGADVTIPFDVDLEPSGTARGRLRLQNIPCMGQMVGGLHTGDSVRGAYVLHPGLPVPDVPMLDEQGKPVVFVDEESRGSSAMDDTANAGTAGTVSAGSTTPSTPSAAQAGSSSTLVLDMASVQLDETRPRSVSGGSASPSGSARRSAREVLPPEPELMLSPRVTEAEAARLCAEAVKGSKKGSERGAGDGDGESDSSEDDDDDDDDEESETSSDEDASSILYPDDDDEYDYEDGYYSGGEGGGGMEEDM